MKKRIISIFLALIVVLGLIPATAFAASSETEALGEVDIYNGGTELSYLSINGRIRTQIYTYYNFQREDGTFKEVPAYCVNPNTAGVPQTVAPGESIQYLADEKSSDPKVMGIVANGYRNRGLKELKLENKYHAYYATKMAPGCYLLPNWDINNLKVNPNLTGLELTRAQAILAAARDIYVRGTTWNEVLSPEVTCIPDRDTAYPVTIDGKPAAGGGAPGAGTRYSSAERRTVQQSSVTTQSRFTQSGQDTPRPGGPSAAAPGAPAGASPGTA